MWGEMRITERLSDSLTLPRSIQGAVSVCGSLHGVTQLEETQSRTSFSIPRLIFSGISGGGGIAANHHPQQVCTHPGTIHPLPVWLCFFCTLSVILAETGIGKEAD